MADAMVHVRLNAREIRNLRKVAATDVLSTFVKQIPSPKKTIRRFIGLDTLDNVFAREV
jgi:hypothetical protein